MENAKFKKSLFGYKKKSVNEYVVELSIKTQKMLNQRDDEIEDLKKENEALSDKVAALTEKNNMVGEAIFAAEKKDAGPAVCVLFVFVYSAAASLP